MFGRWLRNLRQEETLQDASEELKVVVRRELSQADEETVLVVAAVAGLLAAVAYADRDYSPREEERVQRELGRMHGMTQRGVDAICAVLRARVIEMSTLQTPRYCRILLELADLQLRREVLDTLVEIAAVDGAIDTVEVNTLRLLATALGLGQDDYNTAQAKHRERLSVLG